MLPLCGRVDLDSACRDVRELTSRLLVIEGELVLGSRTNTFAQRGRETEKPEKEERPTGGKDGTERSARGNGRKGERERERRHGKEKRGGGEGRRAAAKPLRLL